MLHHVPLHDIKLVNLYIIFYRLGNIQKFVKVLDRMFVEVMELIELFVNFMDG
jgi:hypothetical protein